MGQAWDYSRALEELWNRSSYERGLISDPFGDRERAERGLRRMRALLAALGDPHRRTPAVHVAGSKGKGSTAALIAAAARKQGLRVGLYSSPHLHRFPERIAIDSRPISDGDFAGTAMAVAEAARRLEGASAAHGTVSTFEFLTAMAFLAFADAACDLSVIEVGLGGLYDATNVLEPIVSVITRLDLEHTAVLGSTLAEIAAQKAGIMRPGVPCVCSPQDAAAAVVIARAAADAGAPLRIGGKDWRWEGSWRSFMAEGPWGRWGDLTLGMPGPHQVENACTALAALHEINAAGIPVAETAIRQGFAALRSPGRFERQTIAGRDIVLDGAHTPAAAAALVETWEAEMGAARPIVIVGMGADKDIGAFLAALRPLAGHLIATRADSPRAAEPTEIAHAADALGLQATTRPSVGAAIEAALSGSPSPVLITGSLFVAAEGREALGLATHDEEWQRLNDARAPRTNAASPTSGASNPESRAPTIR